MLKNEELITTLITYADNGMNATKTGKALCITNGAVRARLLLVKKETGIDPDSFYGLAELLGYRKTKNVKIKSKERKKKK